MRTRTSRVVLGLDLSLRATAMTAIPEAWAKGRRRFDWKLIRFGTIGGSLAKTSTIAEQIARAEQIAWTVAQFARDVGATDVFVEEYAFSQNQAGARLVAELGGIVKRKLVVELGHKAIAAVIASSARKLAFGKIARGTDMKKLVASRLEAVGAPFENGDERDAWVIANYGLTECGLPAMTIPA
jgi:hypothetical protein